MRIVVMHTTYGCETGCCGHTIEVDGKERRGAFAFDHPWDKEERLEFAKELIRSEMGEEHVKDLDWENSLVVDSDNDY